MVRAFLPFLLLCVSTPEKPANVSYEEADLYIDFPGEYRRYLPNLNYRTLSDPGNDQDFNEEHLRRYIN